MADRTVETFVIKSSDVERCRVQSILAAHYRPDGSCRCPKVLGYMLVEVDDAHRRARDWTSELYLDKASAEAAAAKRKMRPGFTVVAAPVMDPGSEP